MDRLRVAALADAAGAQLAEVARVFGQYRPHYGEPAAPRQTLAWLTRCTRQGQLTIVTAYRGQDLAGPATTVTGPASLQLGCYRQLRDLYVIPAHGAAVRTRAAGDCPPGSHCRWRHPPAGSD